MGAIPTVICEGDLTQESKFNRSSITCHPVALAVGKKGKCCALSALKAAVMLASSHCSVSIFCCMVALATFHLSLIMIIMITDQAVLCVLTSY